MEFLIHWTLQSVEDLNLHSASIPNVFYSFSILSSYHLLNYINVVLHLVLICCSLSVPLLDPLATAGNDDASPAGQSRSVRSGGGTSWSRNVENSSIQLLLRWNGMKCIGCMHFMSFLFCCFQLSISDWFFDVFLMFFLFGTRNKSDWFRRLSMPGMNHLLRKSEGMLGRVKTKRSKSERCDHRVSRIEHGMLGVLITGSSWNSFWNLSSFWT